MNLSGGIALFEKVMGIIIWVISFILDKIMILLLISLVIYIVYWTLKHKKKFEETKIDEKEVEENGKTD